MLTVNLGPLTIALDHLLLLCALGLATLVGWRVARRGGDNPDGDHGLDQAVAQLHEVLYERLLGAGEFVFFVGGFGHGGFSWASRPPMQRRGRGRLRQWNFWGR